MEARQLARALGLFATLDPGALPLHHLQCFLEVAARGEPTYRELQDALNLSHASVSRTLNSLAAKARHRQNGLGLVEIFIDPEVTRRYRVRLSRKGKSLIRSLEAV